MKSFNLVSALLLVASAVSSLGAERKDWAVLVAGSKSYINYRHQADVCHAYQILHNRGIPDERIIVFMYNDIADNSENPTPGILINYPNGSDVYHGVPKDYQGSDVNPENFLNAITGNKKAMLGIGSGKVLESGPDDHVFIYFADHGGPGLIGFPSSFLYADDLSLSLHRMYKRNMYKQLVFYLEACESGSMFTQDLLPKNLSIYAMTAANASQPSLACYFDKTRGIYLADVFSAKWMENTEQNGTNEDLFRQFLEVRMDVSTSHVSRFGDFEFEFEEIQEFIGGVQGNTIDKHIMTVTGKPAASTATIQSPDIIPATLYNRLAAASTEVQKAKLRSQLAEELTLRNKISEVTRQIVSGAGAASNDVAKQILTAKAQPRDYGCLKAVTTEYSEKCFSLPQIDFALRQVHPLANMCNHKSFSTSGILASIRKVCQN
eukprot:scpid78430/ scgid8352/ Legumain; Asparaginyl endopeptidase; Protease, cysteine 1